jgi:hypothetical protein
MNIAVVIFADTETHGDLGRAVNALMTVKEASEAGDEIRLIFDGAGTKWVGVLADPGHRSHNLYKVVEDQITGVCQYCAEAFGATDAVQAAGVPLLDEYHQHPSLRSLVAQGFQILVF